ncbi:MAG: glycosyltransferase [Nitrososphaerota archaeon]
MNEVKIAAVVVTFNRKDLLVECLNALVSQTGKLDTIFIIDGPSTSGTSEALLKYGYINELPTHSLIMPFVGECSLSS